MFQRSISMPSRRSSVNEVTLQTSASTPKSCSSSSAAASTSRRIVPEPSSCTRGFFGSRRAGVAQQVHAAQDAVLRALRHRRVHVVLVHQRQVVEDVLLLGDHPAQTLLDDHRDLIAEGRVVGAAVRHDREQHVAVAVLVLQALAVERRASGGAAEQEAARPAVGARPRSGRRRADSRTSSSRCRTGSSARRARCRRCRRR